MAWKLNNKAFEHAKKLIKDGKISDEKWSKPNLSDFKDIEEYALFHLGKDPEGDPKLAGSYAYPYGRDGKVYIQALKAIRAYSAGARGAEKNDEIYKAAGTLLDQIAVATGKGTDKKELQKELDGTVKENVYFESVTKYNEGKLQRIVEGPVLIPGYKDCDYHRGEKPLTTSEINDLMQSFYQYQLFDVKHDAVLKGDFSESVGELLESWQLKEDCNGYPKGTWMISAKITDDKTWERVKAGELVGFSVSVLPRNLADKIVAKSSDRRLLSSKKLISDINDPVVATISLTDKPCVYDAKIISIKEDNMETEENVLKKIYEVLKGYFSTKEDAETKTEPEKAQKAEKLKETPETKGEEDAEKVQNNVSVLYETLTKTIEETTKKIEEMNERLAEIEAEKKAEKEETKEQKPAKQETQKPEPKKEETKKTEPKKAEKPKETPKTKVERKAIPPDMSTNAQPTNIYEILGRDAFGRVKR